MEWSTKPKNPSRRLAQCLLISFIQFQRLTNAKNDEHNTNTVSLHSKYSNSYSIVPKVSFMGQICNNRQMVKNPSVASRYHRNCFTINYQTLSCFFYWIAKKQTLASHGHLMIHLWVQSLSEALSPGKCRVHERKGVYCPTFSFIRNALYCNSLKSHYWHRLFQWIFNNYENI